MNSDINPRVKETNTMKRFFTRALAASLLFGAGLLALSIRPLAAADATSAFRQADKGLADALAKGDAKAVAALLDDRFEWVEANGKMHTKAEVLEGLAQFAADNEGAI